MFFKNCKPSMVLTSLNLNQIISVNDKVNAPAINYAVA